MRSDSLPVNAHGRWSRLALTVYGVLIFVFLFAPIGVLILLSFNTSRSVGFPMAGYTLSWYTGLSGNYVIMNALQQSLYVAFWVTIVSTVVGAAAAFPLVRSRMRFKGAIRIFITLPILLPGMLIGVALLVLVTNVMHLQPSIGVAIIGQSLIATPYVVLVVSSRLSSMDTNLERAGADLGANAAKRMWYIVLPLLLPAILAGALMSFTLSLDEFVVTNFIIGADQTLPIYIYNQLKYGITPEVNALATVMLVATLVLFVVSFVAARLIQRMLRGLRARALSAPAAP